MARKAKFSAEQFIDAALDLAAEQSPAAVTIAALAERMTAPVGSVYHRFASRDLILARLWLRTVEAFQEGFIKALRRKDGLAAALYTPQWVRTHLKEAKLLLLYRREDLMSGSWPVEVESLAARLSNDMSSAMVEFTRDLFGHVSKEAIVRTTFALIDVPYASVRQSLLAGKAPSIVVDELVAETYMALLGKVS
jgi:AcrR family transcriptional regulator